MRPTTPEPRRRPSPPGLFTGALVALVLGAGVFRLSAADDAAKSLFARDNLIAWCIVPFDSKKRGPEDRAAMLQKLGFKHFAYDWRAEHVPTFDAEIVGSAGPRRGGCA